LLSQNELAKQRGKNVEIEAKTKLTQRTIRTLPIPVTSTHVVRSAFSMTTALIGAFRTDKPKQRDRCDC